MPENRRGFLKILVLGVNGLLATLAGVPIVGYLISPIVRGKGAQWIDVGKMDEFQDGPPQARRLKYVADEGYGTSERSQSVWVLAHGEQPIVYAAECTHAGCNVLWRNESEVFECPCHGGAFARTGEVLAGPPPHPLRRFPTKIENGRIFISV